jgi:hypothetical protein
MDDISQMISPLALASEKLSECGCSIALFLKTKEEKG